MSSRAKTGIAEMDEMLYGGFMPGDSVLVSGSAGSGKTTLALQYIVNGATRFGENGIYVTFEELPSQLYRDAKSMGWDLRKLEEENKVRIVCTSPDLLAGEGGERLLDPFIEEVSARRIAIDSMSHIELYLSDNEFRREAYKMIMYLKTKGISSMLTYEASQFLGQARPPTQLGIGFLVDTIVMLGQVEMQSSLRKMIGVVKMRGSDHDKRLREYQITESGLKIGTPFVDYEGILTGSARKLSPTKQAVERFSEAFDTSGKKR